MKTGGGVTLSRTGTCEGRAPTSQGYRVIRFWNDEVMDKLEGVVQRIQAALAEGG
jgi:very-short-patch-repair endonuclease